MKIDTSFARTALAAALVLHISGAVIPAAELGIQGTRFTIDGKPVFLAGASYYGGLGAQAESVRKDLDDLRAFGINWIRVWATWTAFGDDVSAVDKTDGSPREPYVGRLKALVDECDRRGMIVNVSLCRGNSATGPSRIQSLESHRRAVESIVSALKDRRNWYLDLANERNIRDARYTSSDDLKDLRAFASQLAPRLLVTASHVGDPGKEEVEKYLKHVGLDFLSIHRRRDERSAAETKEEAEKYRAILRELGREAPINYDEPFRRGYEKWEPVAKNFLDDLRGAVSGGAAGWCFHNGDRKDGTDGSRPRRSFDLRERRLLDQLDEEEKKVLQGIKAATAAE